ncbi:MAG TPA: FHA domain-containing protein [Pyrinomonadaceae bacterium]|nr:FHA domain-containing protein [Pyrinomonadaceae bacterium]
MAETPRTSKNNLTPDWFVQGLLTRIGDTFDRLTGRGWKPSSSLATSELIERMKSLLDSEVQESPTKGKFVPHNIKLKIQWDKFSTDSDSALRTLENELLTAAVDHINDRRYYTYAPLSIEVKPDYFTSGVKLYVSFDKFDENEREAELHVTVPGMKLGQDLPEIAPEPVSFNLTARFVLGIDTVTRNLVMKPGHRLSIGRTKENALTIDDASVSKIHASIMVNAGGGLIVADTGSTNGTFLNDVRIPYGKAIEVGENDNLKFGTVGVELKIMQKPAAAPVEVDRVRPTESYAVGEFEFTSKKPGDSLDPLPAVSTVDDKGAEPKETIAPQPALTNTQIEIDSQEEIK